MLDLVLRFWYYVFMSEELKTLVRQMLEAKPTDLILLLIFMAAICEEHRLETSGTRESLKWENRQLALEAIQTVLAEDEFCA